MRKASSGYGATRVPNRKASSGYGATGWSFRKASGGYGVKALVGSLPVGMTYWFLPYQNYTRIIMLAANLKCTLDFFSKHVSNEKYYIRFKSFACGGLHALLSNCLSASPAAGSGCASYWIHAGDSYCYTLVLDLRLWRIKVFLHYSHSLMPHIGLRASPVAD